MGGKGSGRHKEPQMVTPIGTEIILPNHSGVSNHPEIQKVIDNIDLSAYVLKAGDTMTGDLSFGDDDRIIMGDSGTSDFSLKWNGSNPYYDSPMAAHVFVRSDTFAQPSPSADTAAMFFNAASVDGICNLSVVGGPTGTANINLGNTTTENDGYIRYDNVSNQIIFNGGGTNLVLMDTTRITLLNSGTDVQLRFSGSGTNGNFIYESDNDLLRWNRDMAIKSNTYKLYFGNGYAGSVSHNGTNLIIDSQEVGSGHIVLNSPKTSTGDPTGVEGMIYWNTIDNVIKMYADSGWRTLASW